MKIIYMLDTDDSNKIEEFRKKIQNKEIAIPMDEETIKVYVISDEGKVTKLK